LYPNDPAGNAPGGFDCIRAGGGRMPDAVRRMRAVNRHAENTRPSPFNILDFHRLEPLSLRTKSYCLISAVL
jgi:hypothetical protein